MPTRKSLKVGGVSVAAGSRTTIDLPVSTLSDHTPVTLSVHVIRGKLRGPKMFISAGIHGDEVIGVEIVRRLLRSSHMNSLRGTLLVVPIVNTFGFLNHSRYLPDRRDLNRCFPGSVKGSLASRLAHLFATEVVSKCSYGIDLHSAAIHRMNLPQIRVTPGDDDLAELAEAFGAPVIVTSPLRDGSLRATARDTGAKVLLFEGGEGLRFDEMTVRSGVAGILRVLQHLKMLPPKRIAPAKAASLKCAASKWLRAPTGGLMRTYKSEGDVVVKGELLAAISDPFGENETELVAQFDGIIIGRAVLPIVNEGDAIYHVAYVASNRNAEAAVGDLAAQLVADPLFDEDEII